MTAVEDRPIMSVNHCLPVLVFYFWRKLQRTLQRGLSAIAEHLVLHKFNHDVFEVSSFNRSETRRESQNFKSRSRDLFPTLFDLILHFVR